MSKARGQRLAGRKGQRLDGTAQGNRPTAGVKILSGERVTSGKAGALRRHYSGTNAEGGPLSGEGKRCAMSKGEQV